MLVANTTMRNRVAAILEQNLDSENHDLIELYLSHMQDVEITRKVYENLHYDVLPKIVSELREYIPYRTIWTIGGDGWAYDIGFGGIDHILASNEDVNILVLDTQVYSNTGGQSSKASPKGAIASFATSGKNQNKKDLAKMAMSYSHVYVAQVSLGANPNQLLKAFKEAAIAMSYGYVYVAQIAMGADYNQCIKAFTEAESYHGPSLIIAYAPCISHGIKGGMENSIQMEKEAVTCGYFPLFRYHPVEEKFYLDSKQVDFSQYMDFLMKQTRYSMLYKVNPTMAKELLEQNQKNAEKRFAYYRLLSDQ